MIKISKIKEIANILIFIKNLKKTNIAKNLSYSYTALNNFLVRNSTMRINHLEELFNFLNFPLSTAFLLSEKDLTRKDLIKSIIQIIESENSTIDIYNSTDLAVDEDVYDIGFELAEVSE